MKKHRYIISILAFLSAAACAMPALAMAATTLYFTVPTGTVPLGSRFAVKALVDTDQPVNAYVIRIGAAGTGAVQLDSTDNAHSIITVTQDTPTVTAGGEVSFSGGSIEAFEGMQGQLMTLDFTAIATGTVTFSYQSSYVYLANGKGTKTVPQTRSASVTISLSSGNVVPSGENQGSGTGSDVTPPVISYLSIAADPFNPAQKLLAFRVEDAGSGINETDLRYRSGFFWTKWQKTRNPAPLATNVWTAEFRVIDNAGNATMSTLYDRAAFARFIAAIAAVLLFGIGFLRFFWHSAAAHRRFAGI